LPIDPEIFGTKPPEHLGTANIQPFQIVPAAVALFSFPSWIPWNCALFATLAPCRYTAYSWETASSHGRNTKACAPQKVLAIERDTTLQSFWSRALNICTEEVMKEDAPHRPNASHPVCWGARQG